MTTGTGSGHVRAGAATTAARPRPTAGRRELVVALLCCVAGGAVALLAASRGWVTVDLSRPSPLPPVRLTGSGRAVAPLVPAVGVVGLAGTVGLLATRGTGRRVLGAALAVAGLAVVVRAVPHLAEPSRQAALDLLASHHRTVGLGPAARVTARASLVWPLFGAAGGALLAVGGALAAWRGRRWPGMSGRYDAPARAADRVAAVPTSVELWDAMDRGQDPTDR